MAGKDKVAPDYLSKRFWSIRETAHYLGVGESTIRNRIHRKSEAPFPISAKRIFGKVVFDSAEVKAFADGL